MNFMDRIFKYGLERRQSPFIALEVSSLGNGKRHLCSEEVFFRAALAFWSVELIYAKLYKRVFIICIKIQTAVN